MTKPGGDSVPCSSQTGPAGASNVATYTCSITGAIAGTYSATATYPGDPNYGSASGSDTSGVVTGQIITQAAPMSGTTSTTASSTFADQLATTGGIGAISFAATPATSCGLDVSSSGAISTTGTVAAGTCTVSGTDDDAFGDTGTWTYTLTITPAAIIQEAPTSGTTTTTASAAFTDQLVTSGQIGEVSFDATSTPCGLDVALGAITTRGSLPKGSCTMSGTDSDISGNSGTWTFTLAVTPVSTTTTLSVASSVSYGGEGSEALTVTVTQAGGVLPTGSVTFKDGTTTLCSTTVFTPKAADVVSATCSQRRR